MSTDNALLEFEGGQNAFPMTALQDSGDAQTFESGEELWSQAAGFAPVVRPDGVLTGGACTPASGNDAVAVAAFTGFASGDELAVAAQPSVALTRASVDTHMINSIVCDSAGDVTAVAGTEGTSFSEDRGAAGGPPLIPAGSIELAQVRLSSGDAGPVAQTEIFQLPNRHQERADFPVPTVDNINGAVQFSSALPLSHTDNKPKGVFASFATPEFIEAFDAYDFVPSEVAYSSSSKQTYNRVKNSRSQSLNNATFNVDLNDGISDTIASVQGQELYFRFYPDKNRPQHIIEQGVLAIARTYPAGGDIVAACTINVNEKGKEVAL
ncbi:hypothetical protein [Marinobacter shengliensis]|uniref:hypothetical protein n=1 Tax=Marinobacter shengliensis TaxID=1389223 RepID=UPI0011091C13|nr:hypothetical protein [Marinobacter shengliensis]